MVVFCFLGQSKRAGLPPALRGAVLPSGAERRHVCRLCTTAGGASTTDVPHQPPGQLGSVGWPLVLVALCPAVCWRALQCQRPRCAGLSFYPRGASPHVSRGFRLRPVWGASVVPSGPGAASTTDAVHHFPFRRFAGWFVGWSLACAAPARTLAGVAWDWRPRGSFCIC